MAYRNGMHDPPTMEPIFGSDPMPTPPGYTYQPIFPGGDPTGTPRPPAGYPSTLPPLKQIPAPPTPAGATSTSGLLWIGVGVAALLLLKGKR